MHVPSHFLESDQAQLQQYIRNYGFGLLILADAEGIEANHVPFHLVPSDDGTPGLLQCHLARSNPAWRRLETGARVLAVFQGPDAYVSPSWYATKAETGKVVPTWNYLAVHAEGQARIIQDPEWLQRHLNQLTNQHEAERTEPWSVADAPEDYIERMMQGLVGIEIRIDKLTGKLKASQNQPERNREGVKAGLEERDQSGDRAMASLVGRR